MPEVQLLQKLPRAKRKLSKPRSLDVENQRVARQFGQEYFDGLREQGYGGYKYDGRWLPVARDLVEHFQLKAGDKVLDVGCAKGFLVKDLMQACPGLEVFGLDISEYALNHCETEVQGCFVKGTAKSLPFPDNSFQAVFCINTIHNLDRQDCVFALKEIQRLSNGKAFVQVDAYRTQEEFDIFQGWVLTALTYLKPEEWCQLFEEAGYTGDYDWTVLEADPNWNKFNADINELGEKE